MTCETYNPCIYIALSRNNRYIISEDNFNSMINANDSNEIEVV